MQCPREERIKRRTKEIRENLITSMLLIMVVSRAGADYFSFSAMLRQMRRTWRGGRRSCSSTASPTASRARTSTSRRLWRGEAGPGASRGAPGSRVQLMLAIINIKCQILCTPLFNCVNKSSVMCRAQHLSFPCSHEITKYITCHLPSRIASRRVKATWIQHRSHACPVT